MEEKPTETITKLKDKFFVYILTRENMDLFELSLFKKVNNQVLENFCEEIKRKLEFITTYIKTNQ